MNAVLHDHNDIPIKKNIIPEPIINLSLEKAKATKKLENQKKIREPFTIVEDANLKELVKMYGTKQWKLIASLLNGRTAKQCRDRYTNYLVPGFFRGEWSNDEDLLLMQLYSINGPKWSLLKKYFPHRSGNSIKNRWTYFLSRQYNESELNNIMQLNNNLVVDSQKAVELQNVNYASNDSNNIKTDVSIPARNDNLIQRRFGKEFALMQPEFELFNSFESNLIENSYDWFI